MVILKERYLLHEKLGEGGMAEVYRATQTQLDREVAIKFLATHLTGQDFESRFIREAKAVARLNHPNIVQVYDFDRAEDGRYFMVMELLRGHDLATHLKIKRQFTLGEVITITRQIAEALGYAHQQGIVHRDIKPHNVFLTDDQRVVVTDFGLARMLSEGELTRSGMVIGTPYYFAPEQATGQGVDHRADLYALGVVFYQLLTGTLPYMGDTTLATIALHAHAPIPDPREKRPDLPALATLIVQQAMTKNPADRYPDARSMIAHLEALAQETGVQDTLLLPKTGSTPMPPLFASTPPAAPTPRFSPTPAELSRAATTFANVPAKSRRGWWVAAAVIAVLIAAGAFFLLFQNDNETAEESDAPVAIEFAAANDHEYLVVVANFAGDEAAGVDAPRRITNALRGGDAELFMGDKFRVEETAIVVASKAEAEALAAQSGATVIIWGVQDAAGLEVVIQADGYDPQSVTEARFTVPSGAEFGEAISNDMPVVASVYTMNMLTQQLVIDNEFIVLQQAMTNWMAAMDDTDFAVVPGTRLDQSLLDTSILFIQNDYEGADNAATAVIDLKPNDIGMYFIRWMFNLLYLNRPERAAADAQRIAELTPDSLIPQWMNIFAAFIYNDYEQVIEDSNDLPETDNELILILRFYRTAGLAYLGDFRGVLEEVAIMSQYAADPALSAIAPDGLGAMIYEVIGDDAASQASRDRLRINRRLDSTIGTLSSLNVDLFPVGLIIYAGYYAESSGNLPQALILYQTVLAANPDGFIAHWRRGVILEATGSYQQAYESYLKAAETAPVPFPIAYYETAEIISEHGADLDDPMSACDALSSAREQANTDAELYVKLIEKMDVLAEASGCS